MNLFRKIVKYCRLLIFFFLGKIRSLFTVSNYGIKRGYRSRRNAVYFDDTGLKDEYQNEVYQLARFYADAEGYRDIIDIGCGSAFKLMKYFEGYITTGIDVDTTYHFLKNKYPEKKWVKADDRDSWPTSADIIICADVIEHVGDPTRLLQDISAISCKLLFLSTPERDMVRGRIDYGPPENTAHIREWNLGEFYNYISQYFDIITHQVSNVEQATQLLICRQKQDI